MAASTHLPRLRHPRATSSASANGRSHPRPSVIEGLRRERDHSQAHDSDDEYRVHYPYDPFHADNARARLQALKKSWALRVDRAAEKLKGHHDATHKSSPRSQRSHKHKSSAPAPSVRTPIVFQPKPLQPWHDTVPVEHQVARPKSRLLIIDFETLFAPTSHVPGAPIIGRPYWKTFLSFVVHPGSPYLVAIWTTGWEDDVVERLHSLGIPGLSLGADLLAVWGREIGQPDASEPKDLRVMWDLLNLHNNRGVLEWGTPNSVLVETQDEFVGISTEPDSVITAPPFTSTTIRKTDDFLLQLIGALDDLAPRENFAETIKRNGWENGIPAAEQGDLNAHGREVCARMGIKISGGSTLLPYLPLASALARAHPDEPVTQPITGKYRKGRVHVDSLHGCCKDPPHPAATIEHGPSRVAEGSLLFPNEAYLHITVQPSLLMAKPKKPLVCFDLDGTLYTRPPCHLDPLGDPAGRPYLRTFLEWLFRPSSPYAVAIWTGSEKATAVRCLHSLDLGLVGPRLVGPNKDQPEILDERLVAVWAREDLGLTPADFHAYVSVVKDLDYLWSHLETTHVGTWTAYDTVHVDDTPSKLRGQPDSLISAPTWDYPLEPGPRSDAAMLDHFLLYLIGMLDELSLESNFANYIKEEHWYDGVGDRADELLEKGMAALTRAGIVAAAEGHGSIERSAAEFDPELAAARSHTGAVTIHPIALIDDEPHPSSLSVPRRPTSGPGVTVLRSQASSGALHADHPVTSFTPVLSTDATGGVSASLPPVRRTAQPSSASVSRRSARQEQPQSPSSIASDSGDDDGGPSARRTPQSVPRFVLEEEERARRNGGGSAPTVSAGGSRRVIERTEMQRLEYAVEDWELEANFGAEAVVDKEPYSRSVAPYRR